jgi:hypothetical protein
VAIKIYQIYYDDKTSKKLLPGFNPLGITLLSEKQQTRG